MTVRELITTWGFDIDTKPLADLKEHINGVKETLLHLGELVMGEGASLFGLAETTADAAVGFKRTAEEVGTTTGRLQELSYAAKQWDIDNNAMQVSLRHLSSQAVMAMNGSTNAMRVLTEAGVKTLRDSQGHILRSDQLLGQIAEHFKTMPDGVLKTGLAMQALGRGGAQIMPLLNRWGTELDRVTKQGRDLGYVMGGDAVEASEKFKDSTNEVRAMLTGLRNTIGVALMPAIEGMVDQVKAWYLANQGVIRSQIVEFAKQLSDAVRGAFQMVVILSDVVMGLAHHLGGLGNVLKLVTVGFMAWTAMGIVTEIVEIVGVVVKLTEAFRALAIAEALSTGGISAILGIAGAVGVGAYAYHSMSASSGIAAAASKPAWNGLPGAPTTIIHNEDRHTWNVHLPPGTAQSQAEELGKEMDRRIRAAAKAASNPQSH